MSKKKRIGKKFAAFVIVLLVFAGIAGLHFAGVFYYLECKSYDTRVRFWTNSVYSRPSDDIVIIVIDQDSLDWAQEERGWGWPWPRQAYAEVVNYMNLGGAKSIAFDMIFSEPSVYRNAKQDEIIDGMIDNLEMAQTAMSEGGRIREIGPMFRNIITSLYSLKTRADDASFIKASEDYGRVVQAVVFSSQSGNAQGWPSNLNSPVFTTENFGSILNKFSVGENEKGQFPISGLRESAGALGSVTGIKDNDGIYRRLKPFTLFDGRAIPGLSAASLIVSGKERKISYDENTGALDWGGISIPINKDGFVLLRFKGELNRYGSYNVMQVIQSAEAVARGEEPLLPPSNFADAHVFFGVYAQGLFDIFPTPIDSIYPGVGAHITMLDNMLQGEFISESPVFTNLIILFFVVVLVVILTMFLHKITVALGGTTIIVLGTVAGSFAAYQWNGLWVPMVTFLAGILASFITVNLYNFATEGSQKRFIKSAFSQYLSPKVIEQIIHDPSQLKLGGEKREMTAIFTDVRAFSTISEAMGDPEKLVELLNFYLTRMSDIILDNQGTIDKYEGDAIIAFFGAPIHYDNHASLACRAAVNMKKAEIQINKEVLTDGLLTRPVMEALAAKGIVESPDDPCPLFTRLGINTGDMVVGNMGTPNKMDYTIMGNAVNLAARLEGVNKQYGTGGILISEYTRAQIGDEFVLRPLSRVRVVGINTPLRLYELLDIASDAPAELTEMVKNWEQAFNFYEKRDFISAQNIFQAITLKNNRDMAAKMYLKRCEKYIKSPPDEKLLDNGVDNLTEK